jgi:hypothetical protein
MMKPPHVRPVGRPLVFFGQPLYRAPLDATHPNQMICDEVSHTCWRCRKRYATWSTEDVTWKKLPRSWHKAALCVHCYNTVVRSHEVASPWIASSHGYWQNSKWHGERLPVENPQVGSAVVIGGSILLLGVGLFAIVKAIMDSRAQANAETKTEPDVPNFSANGPEVIWT